jgi:hypothetical protein
MFTNMNCNHTIKTVVNTGLTFNTHIGNVWVMLS